MEQFKISAEVLNLNFFKKETYEKIFINSINFLIHKGYPVSIHLEIDWKIDSKSLESFHYNQIITAQTQVENESILDILFFEEDNLEYHTSQKMHFKLWIFHLKEWIKLEIEYDIHTLTVLVSVDPNHLLQDYIDLLKTL
jgi:hypothetical protein